MEKFSYQEPSEEELQGIFGDDLPPEQRRKITYRYLKEVPGDNKKHLFEIEYEEVRPGVIRKIPGSEKDLGPTEENTNFNQQQ
ncbi:MAG: hypothetical protein NZ822_03135 [Patescibacteria group bacterium]|nr:hypothetical protein [Patescibacteria group bacterium]